MQLSTYYEFKKSLLGKEVVPTNSNSLDGRKYLGENTSIVNKTYYV